MELLPEKGSGYFHLSFCLFCFVFFPYGKVGGRNRADQGFQILPEFFSGGGSMRWAQGMKVMNRVTKVL